MEHITISEVNPLEFDADRDLRRLSDPLDTEDVAINHYTLAPGEAFSDGMHAHMDQEEVFLVVEGTATFETPDGTHKVNEGEAVRFAPGEYQQGRNEGDGELRAFALGAPKESTALRVPGTCPECGHEGIAVVRGDDGPRLECPECGAEVQPE